MRILSLLVSGLAFLATAADATGNREAPDRGVRHTHCHRGRKRCGRVCRWAPAEVPLIPATIYISADQEAHLMGLAAGISRDIRSIGNRAAKGRLQDYWRRTRKGWDMMARCVPTPYKIDIQNYINNMNGLRGGLNYLHQMTKTTKNRITVRQAQYDLIDKNLRLIGLINEIYGDTDLHPALLDYPQAVVKDLIKALKFDVTKPLKYRPSDPVYIRLIRKYRDNRINNSNHPTRRE